MTEYEVVTRVRLEADGGVTGRRRVAVLRAEDPVADRFASARTDGSLRIWSSLTKVARPAGGGEARDGRAGPEGGGRIGGTLWGGRGRGAAEKVLGLCGVTG